MWQRAKSRELGLNKAARAKSRELGLKTLFSFTISAFAFTLFSLPSPSALCEVSS
jgi:hypothetical protein